MLTNHILFEFYPFFYYQFHLFTCSIQQPCDILADIVIYESIGHSRIEYDQFSEDRNFDKNYSSPISYMQYTFYLLNVTDSTLMNTKYEIIS